MPKWTKEEIDILYNIYPKGSKEDICNNILNHSWGNIMAYASNHKIKKLITSKNKNGDLSYLLENSPEAYYWMGFLLADGTFDAKNSLCLATANKDKEQIELFANFLTAPKNRVKTIDLVTNFSACKIARLTCCSVNYMPQIKKKFDLHLNKTINPPKISSYNILDNLLLALFIGYVDGDGCIDKTKKQIKFTVHSNWLDNLKFFKTEIERIMNKKVSIPGINKAGYAFWSINKTTSKLLMDIAKILNLPILNRKWNILNESD